MSRLKTIFQISADPSLIEEAELYWTLDGRGTAPEWTGVRRVAGEEAEYTLTLTIPAVTRAEVGQFACHVITSFDSAISSYARLSVRSGTFT